MTHQEALDAMQAAVEQASAMHFDGCHKIYLSMDEATVDQMVEYGYNIEPADFDTLKEWFDKSCSLRFVSAISNKDDFTSVIPQFALESWYR